MLKLWDKVKTASGQVGKVVATSNSDGTCIIEYSSGGFSGWIPMNKATKLEGPPLQA